MINDVEYLFSDDCSPFMCLFFWSICSNLLKIFIRLLLCLLLSCKNTLCWIQFCDLLNISQKLFIVLFLVLLFYFINSWLFISMPLCFLSKSKSFNFDKIKFIIFFCFSDLIYYSTFNFSSVLYDAVIVCISQMIKLYLPDIIRELRHIYRSAKFKPLNGCEVRGISLGLINRRTEPSPRKACVSKYEKQK